MIKQNGFVLLAAIFVMVFFALAGIIVASLLSSGSVLAQKDLNSIQAFHIAEGGINFYLATSLEGDSNWANNTGVTKNFGKGYFQVRLTFRSQNSCTVESTGTVKGIMRQLTSRFLRTGIVVGEGGIFCDFNSYSFGLGGIDIC